MGECYIRVHIAKDLLQQQQEPEVKGFLLVKRVYSSDTTIREVLESIQEVWTLLSTSQSSLKDSPTTSSAIGLWDCTMNPPKDITDWPLIYPDMTGPKSKTLHDAGMFPSGTLLVLHKGMHPSELSTADYDDVQYNNKSAQSGTKSIVTGPVLLTTMKDEYMSSRPLPSEVFNSVTTRFDNDKNANDANDTITEETAKRQRRINKENHKKTLQMRTQRLDDRIRKLERNEKDKNKSVSDQVKRMLVKSRATGNTSLKMQDRIYFQCIIVSSTGSSAEDGDDESDTDTKKDYRFFSLQETIAKIISSFPSPFDDALGQVLVRSSTKSSSTNTTEPVLTYRRLPVTMRVYEAISKGYLSDQVDTLIIRWVQDGEEMFPSILDKLRPEDEDVCQQADPDKSQDHMQIETDQSSDKVSSEQCEEPDEGNKLQDGGVFEDTSLATAIEGMDAKISKGKSSKKNSTASAKVRNMQMKSKAKGDKKRIPKMEDRFFLEVVLVNGEENPSGTFQFLSKKDPINRILAAVESNSGSENWEFIVPAEESKFLAIPDTSISLQQAEAEGILKCFDRLILRSRNDSLAS